MVNKNSDDIVSRSDQTSCILSLFNLQESVDQLYESVVEVMTATGDPFELVFIDDGSQDNTFKKLKTIAAKDHRVRVLRMRTSFGETASLDAGLRYSSGERIVFMNGRVRVDPMAVPRFINILKQGQDLVVGWRSPRRDSMLNRWISWIFNRLITRIMKVRLHDINSGIFVTYRSVLQKISFYGDLYSFIPILAAQQGYHVTEEKIEQLRGTFRKSRYPKEYLQRLLDMVTVFFLSRYSKKPIHFLGFLGTVFVIAGLGIEIYLFIYRILQMGPIAGRPLLILGALLLVIGIQMISIGLLGEMLIFTHAGDIEEYNIEEIINMEQEG